MNRKKFFVKKNNAKPLPTCNELILTEDYKKIVCSQSYLGKKGYTIPKSIISKQDEEFLRKDLFVKPFVFGANFGGKPEESAFPVFRENTNKFYLPRFYGINRYGLPSRSEIEKGEDIDLHFSKPLRDYQEKIIDVYIKYATTPLYNSSVEMGNGGILEVPCGRGKCLGKNTPILMYDGTIKLVQDIKTGDLLMGDDSSRRYVKTICSGFETMVEIKEVETSEYYTVNMSHILSLQNKYTGQILDLTINDYLNHPEKNNLLGYRVPIAFLEKQSHGKNLYYYGYTYDIYCGFGMDHICNSRKNQLELLAGFIDKNGHITTDECKIFLPPKANALKDSILYLTRSLGYYVRTKYDYNNIIIQLFNTKYISVYEIPLLIKKNIYSSDKIYSLAYEITTRILKKDKYYGFEIDRNRRFVLGDFTVTHNTVLSLKIISLLKKKTLILVHKEFLMNQWIERINEFLPGAKVGKIQAATFDVENKDIVIGMIQTLYDKEYHADTFSCFGLTIIDEVHRIGSEQFSRTLFKTITPYMLGISATVDRKDKLTRILYMFIGDKIYSEKRDDDDIVSVRGIRYMSNDQEFNQVEYDFRGNPKYSTMITKLCDFGPRSDFIIRIIGDLIKEEPENQIMILCHNRSLLSYLYEGIIHRNIATVGYYIGGMKQEKLQETESKQIVLATYAMAAEALDIKTLSTLVMVTPKTDITQSVGRILRVKHNNPIIVDLIDSHELFENQWKQRKRFYKKCNYKIREIDSNKYSGMNIEWEKDITWTKTFDPKIKEKKSESSDEEEVNLNNTKCLINFGNLDGL